MPVGLGNESKGWKLVTSGTRKTAPLPPADLQLLNILPGSRQGAGSWELCPVKNQSQLRLSSTAAPRGSSEWQQRATDCCGG